MSLIEQEAPVVPSGIFKRSWLIASLVLVCLGLGLWVRLVGDGLPLPSRVWAALAWLVTCLGVFFIARRISSIEGALAALAISLFLPFAVFQSREELTASIGVMCLVWYLYALIRWSEADNWRWALAASLSGGLAVTSQIYLLFPAIFSLIGLLLSAGKFRLLWKSIQGWIILGGMILLPIGLAMIGVSHPLAGISVGWNSQVLQPWWIIRWLNLLRSQIDLNLILLSLLGVLLLPGIGRGLLLGGWLGYVLSAILLSQDILTHHSIHLIVVPLAALSLSPVAQAVIRWISTQNRGWQIAFSLLLILSLAYAIHLVSA